MLIFDCQLKDGLTVRYKCHKDQPLRLIFCVEHGLTHNIEADGLQYDLGSLKAAMVSGKAGSEQLIIIPTGSHVVYYCIDIERKKYHAKIARAIALMPEELKKVFEDTRGKYPFLYLGSYNLGISECIQNIRHNNLLGAVRRVYIESQTLEIMSMIIKQFIEDLAPGRKPKVLRKRDMELIAEARKRLLANLINPPTIRELAQMMGTNENKLKSGFRLMYNTSINKLLQDERLTKARMLMSEETYPIKEVAKMVGYKHSAHFASKFKKRFGILPNAYVKSMVK
jgi:AraC-like DNA-binding protein